MRIRRTVISLAATLGLVGLAAVSNAQTARVEPGSWFGRALPDSPWCTPGGLLNPADPSLGPCPIPREIIMLPTFWKEGIFMGIASHEFSGGGEAHGTWRPASNGIEADWLFLEKGPDGKLIGASHMRLAATAAGQNRLTGVINAYFFPFVGPDGLARVDPSTGRMIPDPLQPIGPIIESGTQCAPPVNGCLGVFKFVIDRITVQ